MAAITQVFNLQDLLSPGLLKMAATAEQVRGRMGAAGQQMEAAMGNPAKRLAGNMKQLGGSVQEAAGEIPGLGRAMALVTNPAVAAGAAIAAIGAGLWKAGSAAVAFQTQMTAVTQLNFDKSAEDMATYRQTILDTAFKTGIASDNMAEAFYNVQSATGLFGEEAAFVAEQVGRWAMATGSDYQSQINSATKAMNAFGLGAKDITTILAAQNAAVQFGVTTQEEYGRVLTEFSGAAAAAGQDISTASGIFAAFTQASKDSGVAATLTKTALQGLTSQRAADEMGKIGVKLYDAKGQMRQMDEVMAELAPKLQKMSDQDFATFRESVGGPEGMAHLLNTVKVQGDAFAGTLNKVRDGIKKFDLVAFEQLAAQDPAKAWEMATNRINVVLTEIGQHFLPILGYGIRLVESGIDRLREVFRGGINLSAMFQRVLKVVQPIWDIVVAQAGRLWESVRLVGEQLWIAVDGFWQMINQTGTLSAFMGYFKESLRFAFNQFTFMYQLVLRIAGGILQMYNSSKLLQYAVQGVMWVFKQLWSFAQGLYKFISDMMELILDSVSWVFDKIAEGLAWLDKQLGLVDNKAGKAAAGAAPPKPKGDGGGGDPPPGDQPTQKDASMAAASGNVQAVSGGGSQPKVINITIGAIQQGDIQVITQQLQGGLNEALQQVNEALVRTVRDAELAL